MHQLQSKKKNQSISEKKNPCFDHKVSDEKINIQNRRVNGQKEYYFAYFVFHIKKTTKDAHTWIISLAVTFSLFSFFFFFVYLHFGRP